MSAFMLATGVSREFKFQENACSLFKVIMRVNSSQNVHVQGCICHPSPWNQVDF